MTIANTIIVWLLSSVVLVLVLYLMRRRNKTTRDIEIPEFDQMPDQSPPKPLKINPPFPGIYKTQYTPKIGLTVTEPKFWSGEVWCDTKQRNLISFIQNRTWEMIEEATA